MSVGKRVFIAVSISWLSKVVTIFLSLMLIPLLFKHLGKEELGFWFLLGQSTAFLALMDFGISPTLTRRIAFAKGKNGGDYDVKFSQETKKEIADLIFSGKIIYRYLTILVFLLSWVTGYIFISNIEFEQVNANTVWVAWTIMCLGHALSVWGGLWTCLLQGTGNVGLDFSVNMVINISIIVTQMIVVVSGGGLIELAIVNVLGALTTRYLILVISYIRSPELFRISGVWNKDLVQSMCYPAFKAWLTAVGAFCVLRTDQYFIALYEGTKDIPTYHASYQLVSNLSAIVIVFAIASRSFISQSWQAGCIQDVQKIVIRNLRLGLGVMVCGVACLLLAGENVINLWLGEGNYLGSNILIIFCIMLTLDAQQQIIYSASRATEFEVYFISWLLAGTLNIIFTLYLVKYYGVFGVALGTLLAQLITNNWYVCYRGLKRLQISANTYLFQVLSPVVLQFIIAFLVGHYLLQNYFGNSSDIVRLMVALLVTGSVLTLGGLHFLYSQLGSLSNLHKNFGLIGSTKGST